MGVVGDELDGRDCSRPGETVVLVFVTLDAACVSMLPRWMHLVLTEHGTGAGATSLARLAISNLNTLIH